MHTKRHPLFRAPFHRRLFVLAIVSIVGPLVLPVVETPAQTSRPLFELIGTLERFPADARDALGSKLVPTAENAARNHTLQSGTLIAIPERRQLWQLYPADDGSVRIGIVVRDLDSLRIVKTLLLDELFDRAGTHDSLGGNWYHAVDKSGTRLWFLQWDARAVLEFDTRTFTLVKRPIAAGVPGIGVAGLTYDPFRDDLLILYGGPGATGLANVNTFVYQLDVSVAAATSPPTEPARLYKVRACTAAISTTDQGGITSGWEFLVTEDHLYVPCQRAGHTVIVVRMTRPPSNPADYPDHREDVAAGPVYGDTVLADQQGRRLFVTTTRREIWAFETNTMSFVGVVATAPDNTDLATGYGLDPATGRVYFQSKHFGLGVAEGRFFPIPQARTMPRPVTGQERILADAATRRVFVLEGDGIAGTPHPKAPAYHIYRTDPAPVPPPPPDSDRNTADTDEREGVTEARYNATGSGYGSRILWARGVATVPPAPTVGVLAPTADVTKQLGWACGLTDRQIVAGRVAKAEYDTGSTAAQAVAVDVDDATKQDVGKPSRCDFRFSVGPALQQFDGKSAWDYESAMCATSTNDTSSVESHGSRGSLDLGPSTVGCPVPGERLTARAESRLAGVVQVERAFTETVIGRENASKGVTSRITAVAQGVSISLGDATGLPAVRIGEVRSTAVSNANGRPRRPDLSAHEVRISDVYVGDEPVCTGVCPDPQDLEARLNVLAAGRAVFRTGLGPNSGRDDALLGGSPRGAQTAVQKSVARQASDRALLGDFTIEVPGLEMIVFNDNTSWGRARQVYQLAGVASSVTYNIVVRPVFDSFPDDPGNPLEDLPAVLEVNGTSANDPLSGLPTPDTTAFSTAPAGGQGGNGEGGLVGVVKAVARGLRLFLTNPRTALLLLTVWALLASPPMLARRRRLLAGVRNG